MIFSRKSLLTLSSVAAITSSLTLAAPLPSQAAERIYFNYGLLSLSLQRQDLEDFAATGVISPSLRTVLSRFDDAAQEQLREALQARYEVDPILVNRFSYTRSGEQLLESLGLLVQTESGQNGFYSLRAALTLAAVDEDGLTLLNLFRQLPTDMRVNVAEALAIARDLNRLLADTQQAMAALAETTESTEANTETMAQHQAARSTANPQLTGDFHDLPDPRQRGQWPVSAQTLQLYDGDRDRSIAVDIYTPQPSLVDTRQSLPLIVVSNGLGARRSRFDELALHLASYGFAVVMLDHPGSDRQRLQEFYQGLHSENFEATEFVDRPLDVSFVLDELTQLNEDQFGDRLDPNNVGVFGYSFGGTTALALAGAEIDREHLQQACATRTSLFNISLLYQCRALELSPAILDVQTLNDERIQAIYVYVPFSRSLYGPNGLAQVTGPVFWEATEQDVLTPLVIEQLPAFAWLTGEQGSRLALSEVEGGAGEQGSRLTLSEGGVREQGSRLALSEVEGGAGEHRYLVVSEGLPHARLTLDVVNRLTNQSVAWEAIKPITETYHQMLTTIFFQVYLAREPVYCPYLHPQGMQYLAQASYPVHWGAESGPSTSEHCNRLR